MAGAASANAVAQASIRLDRSLLLAAEGVRRDASPETAVGLLTALDAARHLVAFRTDLGDGNVSATVSPDGTEVVTVTGDGRIDRRSLADGTVLASATARLPHPLNVQYVSASVIHVDTEEGGELRSAETLEPQGDPFVAAEIGPGPSITAVSPDGTLLALSAWGSPTIDVVDAATRSPVTSIAATGPDGGPGCARGVTITVFGAGADTLYAACLAEAALVAYDVATGAPVARHEGGPFAGISTNVDGTLVVATGFTNEVTLMRAADLELAQPVIEVPGGRPYAGDFSDDGRLMVVGTDDGSMLLWDVEGRRELDRVGGLEDGLFVTEIISADARVDDLGVLAGSLRVLVLTLSSVTEWDLGRANAIGQAVPGVHLGLVDRDRAPIDAAAGVAYAPPDPPAPQGGETSAAVSVRSLADGAEQRTITVDGDWVTWLSLSGDGDRLAGLAVDWEAGTPVPTGQRIVILDPATGAVLQSVALPASWLPRPPPTFEGARAWTGLSLRFSPDGDRLTAVAFNGRAAVIDTATGSISASGDVGVQQSVVAWSADGGVLAMTGEVGVIDVFDAATLAHRQTVDYSRNFTVSSMYPSAALGGIVVTSEGGEIVVLDPLTGGLVGDPFHAGGSQLQTSRGEPRRLRDRRHEQRRTRAGLGRGDPAGHGSTARRAPEHPGGRRHLVHRRRALQHVVGRRPAHRLGPRPGSPRRARLRARRAAAHRDRVAPVHGRRPVRAQLLSGGRPDRVAPSRVRRAGAPEPEGSGAQSVEIDQIVEWVSSTMWRPSGLT